MYVYAVIRWRMNVFKIKALKSQKEKDEKRSHILGIGLLEQCAPELISRRRVAVRQLSVDCRQQIVDDHRSPDSETPEPEVENPCVVGTAEFLLAMVDDYL